MNDVAPPLIAPPARWQEPTRGIPLRWSDYSTRVGIAYALVVIAIIVPPFASLLLAQDDTPSGALVVAVLAMLGAIAVLPSTPRARVVGGIVFLVVAVLSLAVSSRLGHFGMSYLIVDLIADVAIVFVWLQVRGRSGLAYLALPIAAVLCVLTFFVTEPLYAAGLFPAQLAVLLQATVIYVGSAWCGRAFDAAASGRRGRDALTPSTAAQPGGAGTWATPQWASGSVPPTNVLAVVAFVFGLFGGLLAIVFGHIALAQIRRTGEGGARLALVGLILGYLWLLGFIVFFVVFGLLMAVGS